MKENIETPLQEFLTHKAQTGMQCGNYSIEVPRPKEGEQYRFHFDATACVGCHCCEAACNELQNNPADIKWRRVGEMEGGVFPEVSQLFNSMSCNHCIEPECLIGCPTNSYVKFEANGIVWHDDESCIGCHYCTWNCPYEVPVFNPDRGIVTKCDMCHDKLEVGETPACVQACPAGAIEIEVVNTEAWLAEGMHQEGVAPHLPDVKITKPTTRYTLPDNLPTMQPVDEHMLKPAHPEWPLVFMTVLTQLSLGAFCALFLGELLTLLGLDLPIPTFVIALAALLPAAIGLPLSALHLGRPILAITAMKNWRTSWLSREAIALGVYTFLATGITLLYRLEYHGIGLLLIELVTLGLGIYGIYAQSMIYRIKARPAWDREATNKTFFGTAYVGLLMVATLLVISGGSSAAMALLAVALMVAMWQLLTLHAEMGFYAHLDQEHTLYYQLSRTRQLLEVNFGWLQKSRLYTLMGFGLGLPMIALLGLASGLVHFTSILLVVATVGVFCSELMGRYLFYTTVVPLGLAGNFFAGNQRG